MSLGTELCPGCDLSVSATLLARHCRALKYGQVDRR
jgi:hypothetical protein